MSMLQCDPCADTTLQDQLNCLFDQSLLTGCELATLPTWSPTVDIFETPDQVGLRMNVSGVNAEDIDIQLTGDTLTIKGERKQDTTNNEKQYVRIESTYGSFQRAFTLGVPVDHENIHANYRDGVLEITMPKLEEAQPKHVKIEVAAGPRQTEIAA